MQASWPFSLCFNITYSMPSDVGAFIIKWWLVKVRKGWSQPHPVQLEPNSYELASLESTGFRKPWGFKNKETNSPVQNLHHTSSLGRKYIFIAYFSLDIYLYVSQMVPRKFDKLAFWHIGFKLPHYKINVKIFFPFPKVETGSIETAEYHVLYGQTAKLHLPS